MMERFVHIVVISLFIQSPEVKSRFLFNLQLFISTTIIIEYNSSFIPTPKQCYEIIFITESSTNLTVYLHYEQESNFDDPGWVGFGQRS